MIKIDDVKRLSNVPNIDQMMRHSEALLQHHQQYVFCPYSTVTR